MAVNGGKPVLELEPEDMFHWPIVTAEDEEAVCAVLRTGKMSGTDITKQFEKEYVAWTGAKYALATCNGTAALQEALWAWRRMRRQRSHCPLHDLLGKLRLHHYAWVRKSILPTFKPTRSH